MLGFTFGELLHMFSPAFVVVTLRKATTQSWRNQRNSLPKTSLKLKKGLWMTSYTQELEDHFTFRLVVDFRKLNKRVIPDPYPIPRAQELNRIAKKKVYKTD